MGSKEATRARASALLVLTSQVVTPWLNLTDVFIDYAPAFPLSICITTFVRKPSENIIGTIKANLWCCQHSIRRRQTILISAQHLSLNVIFFGKYLDLTTLPPLLDTISTTENLGLPSSNHFLKLVLFAPIGSPATRMEEKGRLCLGISFHRLQLSLILQKHRSSQLLIRCN